MYLQYPEGVLPKLQKILYDIIRDVDAVCQREGIRYFAFGGTLLGAIRHQGFVPWDDDVDFAMLREDYDRFLAVFDKCLGDKYELWCPERNAKYYSFLPMVGLKGTSFQTQKAKRCGIEDIQIFIEIFVFENIDPEKERLEKQRKEVHKTKMLFDTYRDRNPLTVGSAPVRLIKNAIKTCLRNFGGVLRLDETHLSRRFLQQTIVPEETGWVSHWGDYSTVQSMVKKVDLFPIERVPFAEGDICIPHNYDTLLTHIYGSYLELPPEEDRWNAAPVRIQFPGEDAIDLTTCQRNDQVHIPAI